jgi:hypothetical protein
MGTNVFANNMEIAAKAATGKSTAQFPDVCFTPPTAPPTPPGVPIPYPNTAMASDCEKGSKSVQIRGDEVFLKNKSFMSTSTGDEAGNTPKKGILTTQTKGKAYFTSWSMDVKFEKKNVPRHFDMTTHNHRKMPGNGGPWCYISTMSPPPPPRDPKCQLTPYKDGCAGGKTPHHCVPDHCFKESGPKGAYYPGAVKHADGLCICVSGATKSTPAPGSPDTLADHGKIHQLFDAQERKLGDAGSPKNTASLGSLEDAAAKCVSEVTGCDEKDLKKQMRDYHQGKGIGPNTKLRADPFGKRANPPFGEMGAKADVVGGMM